MEVGDYVRTKSGWIYKIEDGEEFYENSVDIGIGTIPDVDGIWINKAHFQYVDKREIIKSSSNIIDLIQVGDYVNGYKVYEENGHLWIKRVSDDEYKVPHYTRIDFEEFKIKSIVTKESFESMEYKVKE